jgi:hypothetical protein
VTLAGITHLVEHAVLRMVQPVTVWHGGTVTMDSVDFHATGDADAVAGYLNAIAAAIAGFSSLSEEDLALEKAIIEAEDPRAFSAVSGGLLTYRFGMDGLGAGAFGAPTTAGINRAETIAWARQWFTAGNAALTFTGPASNSLDIRLPPGAVVRGHQGTPVITRPTLISSPKGGVAFSLLVPLRDSLFLREALSYELLTRLRHTGGLIYSVVGLTTEIDDQWGQLDLILDPVQVNTAPALEAGVAAVRDVAAAGFTQDAVQAAVRAVQATSAWDEAVASEYLNQEALNGLLRRCTLTGPALRGRMNAITAPALTQALQTALGSLIVAVDDSIEVGEARATELELSLDPYTIWRNHDATEGLAEPAGISDAAQKWPSKTSKAVLHLTETHLLKVKRKKTRSIKLADVVLVGDRSCGCVALTDRRGRTTDLTIDEWRNSKNLRRTLLGAFPAEIVRSFPED